MAVKLIQITAYVRNEDDLARWKALPNKTEAIHQMLNRDLTPAEKNRIMGQIQQAGETK